MDTYTVLLVDDEEEVIQVIMKKIDWAGLGFSVIGYANNGVKALEMVPQESQAEQQDVFNYMVEKVSVKEDMADIKTVKGSQFKQPLLEFSGSCAGCAETAYARLVTQVCGDRMYISNATGCSSIWGGPAATSPYTVDKCGHGPAWANSLFEDNAEHGLGLLLGQKTIRERLMGKLQEMAESDKTPAETKALIATYLETAQDGAANAAATAAMLKAGASAGATGENAVIWNAGKAQIIAGPIGLVMANSMLGECSPAMATAIASSPAHKVLIPATRCGASIAGLPELPLADYIADAARRILEFV